MDFGFQFGHTSQALALQVERSVTGDGIVTVLERQIKIHGAPKFVRMANGTEMTIDTVADCCRFSTADISFIDPGPPWQNAHIESFHGKLRDELLGIKIFTTLLEAKIMAEDYRQDYNHNRPNSPLA